MDIPKEQFRELLDRYLRNKASRQEREMLDRFFESYQPDPSDPDLYASNPDLHHEILRAIHSKTEKAPEGARTRRLHPWLQIAAVISVFVLAYFFVDKAFFNTREPRAIAWAEETTNGRQKSMLELPDGSTVHLNKNSKITYPSNFAADIREVTLSGEAYFDVVKGNKPFVVHANHVSTEVLGTSFNVKNRAGDDVQITLVEGRVNVVTRSGNSSMLAPNQQAVVPVYSEEILTRDVNTVPYTSWKDNILIFEQTTLKEAASILESWYDVKIDIKNPVMEDCLITAKYRNEPLGNVLSSFQFLLNLEIGRTGDKHYSLNGKGC